MPESCQNACCRKPSRRPRRRFIRLGLLSLLAALVLPAPVAFVFGASCSDWKNRRAFESLPPLELVLASDVTVHKAPVLPAGFSGLALSPGVVVLKDGASYQTLAHELAHSFQMRTDGMISYSTRYMYDWYAGLWHGCSIADARHSISYELQAEAVGNLAKSDSYDSALWGAWAYAVEPPGVLAASNSLFSEVREMLEEALERARTKETSSGVGRGVGSSSGGPIAEGTERSAPSAVAE